MMREDKHPGSEAVNGTSDAGVDGVVEESQKASTTKIFLAVGTQRFPFDRLIKAVDDLCESKPSLYQCFGQAGYSQYRPTALTVQPFMSESEFMEKAAAADVVVTHAGTGSIATAMELGRPVVMVPRLARFGEHVDDHQAEIAQVLASTGMVHCCLKVDEIEQTILTAIATGPSKVQIGGERLLNSLRSDFEEVLQQKSVKQRFTLFRGGKRWLN